MTALDTLILQVWFGPGAIAAAIHLVQCALNRKLNWNEVQLAFGIFLAGLIVPTLWAYDRIADFWEWLKEEPEDE